MRVVLVHVLARMAGQLLADLEGNHLALIEPLVLTTSCLVGQLRQFNRAIKEFDHEIRRAPKSRGSGGRVVWRDG
jgi:hypothetical protein